MGGAGGIVEIDETYIGRKEGFEVQRGGGHKNAVLTLVERGGSARSFHVESVKKEDIMPIVRDNLDRETHVMTDEAGRYAKLGNEFARHDAVDHWREEYGYTDRKTGAKINTNTVEGYYSIFKRGMIGVYQHCGEQHFTDIWLSSISAIPTASNSALTTALALNARCSASKASG